MSESPVMSFVVAIRKSTPITLPSDRNADISEQAKGHVEQAHTAHARYQHDRASQAEVMVQCSGVCVPDTVMPPRKRSRAAQGSAVTACMRRLVAQLASVPCSSTWRRQRRLLERAAKPMPMSRSARTTHHQSWRQLLLE